eukprot:4244691-Pyramimonas_sp.AAC.1
MHDNSTRSRRTPRGKQSRGGDLLCEPQSTDIMCRPHGGSQRHMRTSSVNHCPWQGLEWQRPQREAYEQPRKARTYIGLEPFRSPQRAGIELVIRAIRTIIRHTLWLASSCDDHCYGPPLTAVTYLVRRTAGPLSVAHPVVVITCRRRHQDRQLPDARPG